MVGKGRSRASHAKKPLSIVCLSWDGIAAAPPKSLSSAVIGLDQSARRKRFAACRVHCRLSPTPELNGILPEFVGKFIKSAFQREGTDGFSRCAHEGVCQHVHIGDFLSKPEGLG
jgi:hypothetical protein